MSAFADLNHELRGEAPAEFSSLTEPDLRLLCDGLKGARKRQQTQLRKAMDTALTHVPALLRGPVRKILLG